MSRTVFPGQEPVFSHKILCVIWGSIGTQSVVIPAHFLPDQEPGFYLLNSRISLDFD